MSTSETDSVKWIDLGNGVYTVSQEDLEKIMRQGNDLIKRFQANQNHINDQTISDDSIKAKATISEGAVISCVVALILVLSIFVALVMHQSKKRSEDEEEYNQISNRTYQRSQHYASYRNNASNSYATPQTVTTDTRMQRNPTYMILGVLDAEISDEIIPPTIAWIPPESRSNEYNGQESIVLTDIITQDPPPPYECPPPDYQTATR